MTLGLYLALYHPKFSSCICCGSAITMVSMVYPIGSLNVAHAFCGISMGFYAISDCFYGIPDGPTSNIRSFPCYSPWAL